MAKRQIRDSIAVITGASSGIGKQLALQMAEQGATVVLNARREDRLLELVEQIKRGGGKARSVAGDITNLSVQESIREKCESEFGKIDILINNAGVGAIGYFSQSDTSRMRQIMEVNFFSVVELTHQVLPLLGKANNPIVVNVSSVLGHRAVPLKSEYCASKFAVHGFSDSLRAELSKDGIDVLLVSPSTTASEFFDSVLENTSGKSPKLGKPMTPARVAKLTIRAIRKGKHEIILSMGGKFIVWLDRLCPPIANWVMKRWGQ